MSKGTRVVWVPLALMALSVTWSDLLAEPSVVRRDVSAKEQEAAAAYWTPERIAAVRPMPMPVDRGNAPVSLAELAQEVASGPFGSSPSGSPDPDADRIAEMAYWRDGAGLGAEAMAAEEGGAAEGTPAVYTSFDVNNSKQVWKVSPHKAIGRVVFTGADGRSYYCSASAISGNNFVTAAHCVYDTGANLWHRHWAFSPAFRIGEGGDWEPYGTFSVTNCWVLSAWTNLSGSYSIYTWPRYDVAVCKTRPNYFGQALNAVVGYLGRSWNAGYQQLSFNMGYPQKYYDNTLITGSPGWYLRTCVAESFQYATDTLGMGCNWGSGISGGPWLKTYQLFKSGANNYVNAVNSGLYIGQQNIYAGRFNSNNIVPLCNAAGC